MMKAFLNWSGGKDSAYCLHKMQQSGTGVGMLVTSINAGTRRIAMHGVRYELLQQQAASVQLPLTIIELPEDGGMKVYEDSIHQSNRSLTDAAYTTAVFGDIFLEDLKRYREQLYAADGIQCSFPLWKLDSRALVEDFIRRGFKAIVVCVNGSVLHPSFCGRLLDEEFLKDLPEGVDPCGENGEFHSFVFDGPNFKFPIPFEKGKVHEKRYADPVAEDCFDTPRPSVPFYFCELLPTDLLK